MTTDVETDKRQEEVTLQMTEHYFNLADEPWIPVLLDDGTDTSLSILQVFENAERIRQLHGELPTMQPALLRILVAIMARALGLPSDVEDWRRRTTDWDEVVGKVASYLDHHHERFWLKHPSAPFFQVADLGPEQGGPKDLGILVADFPAGVKMFAQRGPISLKRMSPAEAARWLVHAQAYDTSGIKTPDRRDHRAKNGKVYPMGTSWLGKGEVLIASGKNLALTLRLNYIAPTTVELLNDNDDVPPWEREQPGALPEFTDPAEPHGFIETYTWQSRRLRLVFDGEEVIRAVLCYGDRIAEQNRENLDPMMTWRYSKPQSKKFDRTIYMPGIVDPTKSVWRGLSAWLPTKAQAPVDGNNRFKEPGVLRWIGKLETAGLLPPGFIPDIAIFGVQYGPQSATFAEVIDDSISVPAFLLDEDNVEAASTVIAAIDDADTVAWYLGTYATNLARSRGIEQADAQKEEAKESAFLEYGRLFKQWLSRLENTVHVETARVDWQKALRCATENLAHEMANSAGELAYIGRITDVEHDTWMNSELALRYLYRGLRKELPLAFTKETYETQ